MKQPFVIPNASLCLPSMPSVDQTLQIITVIPQEFCIWV